MYSFSIRKDTDNSISLIVSGKEVLKYLYNNGLTGTCNPIVTYVFKADTLYFDKPYIANLSKETYRQLKFQLNSFMRNYKKLNTAAMTIDAICNLGWNYIG